MLPVEKTCKDYYNFFGKEAVSVNFKKLDEIAQNILEENEILKTPKWVGGHFPEKSEEFMQYIFYLNSGNACFWLDENEHWIYKNKKGAEGWMSLVNDLINTGSKGSSEKSKKINLAKYMGDLSLEDFNSFLKNGGKNSEHLKLKPQRVSNFNELGKILYNKYEGDFEKFLEESEWDAEKIVENLAYEFPESYGSDYIECPYVRFDKRNTLVALKLYGGLLERKFKKSVGLSNINSITVASDYRIPAGLRLKGGITYNEELSELIDSGINLKQNSFFEISIRAATIVATKYFENKLNSLYGEFKVTPAQIDSYFFREGRKTDKFHKVETLMY